MHQKSMLAREVGAHANCCTLVVLAARTETVEKGASFVASETCQVQPGQFFLDATLSPWRTEGSKLFTGRQYQGLLSSPETQLVIIFPHLFSALTAQKRL